MEGGTQAFDGRSLPSVSDATNNCGVDETSPDLLKNTPTNIARLEDAIEHCTGRRKYLAQTKSSSDGGDVRWYFCMVPLGVNDLAACIPQTEVVGKGDYFRFGMRDSLAIEASFLQREEELLSSWWREFAECSQGPTECASSGSKVNSHEDGSSSGFEPGKACVVEDERVGVPVKGGLYEVDLIKRHCFPVYWDGENRRVLRGHWFACKNGLDWLPLREDVSEQLEFAYRKQIWHRRTFQPSGLFAARVDLQGSTPGLHALFTGEDDTWEAWLNADVYGFSSVIGLTGNSIKLRRGYSASQSAKPTQDEQRQKMEEEMDDYCSRIPVRHVVFMVHGIGQRLEKSNLVDDVGNFRVITGQLAELHLSSYERGYQRVLFIPCQWRRGLKLSGETAVEKITLDGVRNLRVMLSATVHDVLYYMSPIYCQDIINSVSCQLNRLYGKFLKRNPGYGGKVSVYGHSLGSVLSYDILCHQDNLSSPFPMELMYEGNTRNKDSSPVVSDIEEISPRVSQECEEDPSTMMGCSVTLDAKQKQSVSSLKDDVGGLNSLESIADETFEETDDKFKSLKEEVACLRARIDELESECAVSCKGNVVESLQKDFHPVMHRALSYRPYIRYTKLDFKVDTFFAVGAPLGVFLALRNVRIGIGNGKDYWKEDNINEEMPACRKMFNIFHPFDPVAYRIEPLVCYEYIDKRPVIIPYHKGGKRLHIGFQEFTEDLAAHSQAFVDHLKSVRIKVLTMCQSKNENSLEDASEKDQDRERSYGSMMMERLTGSVDGRIDHMLQDKTFQHAYISAIGSHTSYWRDYDTALFILKHLYQDVPAESSSTKEESNGRTDMRDNGDEEQPLLLSGKISAKGFS